MVKLDSSFVLQMIGIVLSLTPTMNLLHISIISAKFQNISCAPLQPTLAK